MAPETNRDGAMEEAETAETKKMREEAEETCRRAEELFLAGHVAGAYRHARRARRLCPALPGLANALAAYGVHAAAAASPDRPNWYAVLAVEQQSVATTRDAIRRQFRRLSLLVHPDKNRSAAADGAFKILRQACDALSASHHQPGDASASSAAAQHRRRKPPTPTPAPAADANASSSRAPPAGEPRPRKHKQIYCWHCKRDFGRQVGPVEERVGTTCPWCARRLKPPWERKSLLAFTALDSYST